MLLHITSVKQLGKKKNWFCENKVLFKWKYWMTLDVTWLNWIWIEIQFNNWIKIRFNSIEKKWDANCWRRHWKFAYEYGKNLFFEKDAN
jgi:hypothetical protein